MNSYTPEMLERTQQEVQGWVATLDSQTQDEITQYLHSWDDLYKRKADVSNNKVPIQGSVTAALSHWKRKPMQFCMGCLLVSRAENLHLSVFTRTYYAVFRKSMSGPYAATAAEFLGVALQKVGEEDNPKSDVFQTRFMQYAKKHAPVNLHEALRDLCNVSSRHHYGSRMADMAKVLRAEGWERKQTDKGALWYPPQNPDTAPVKSLMDKLAAQCWVVVGGDFHPAEGWKHVVLRDVQTGLQFKAVLEK